MSAAKTKKKRQRTHRYTSNVFSMFNQAQIQEFKEAFNMIDQNRDGFVDKDDLIEMLTSLGKNPDDAYLDGMIREAPGPINFTMFLTLFGEKLNGTDPEDVIQNAFGCFDLTNAGKIPEDRLREIMTTMGDRWTDDRVDELFHGAPINNGLFDYVEFTRTLKHGAREKDEETSTDSAAPPVPSTPPPSTTPTQNSSDKAHTKPKITMPKPQETAKPSTMKPPESNNKPKSPVPPKSPSKASPFGAVLKPAGKSALKKV